MFKSYILINYTHNKECVHSNELLSSTNVFWYGIGEDLKYLGLNNTVIAFSVISVGEQETMQGTKLLNRILFLFTYYKKEEVSN